MSKRVSNDPKQSKSPAGKPDAKSSKKPRKRTGAARRRARRIVGDVRPVDESRVHTADDARVFFTESGRNGLARGSVLRVTPEEDARAFPAVAVLCRHHQTDFTERLLPPHYVAGAEAIVERMEVLLGPVPDLGAQPESKKKGKADAPLELPSPPNDAKVLAAHNFVMRRRASLLRWAKGRHNLELRKAFGMDQPVDLKKPQSVAEAIQALLKGRAANPGTRAARMLQPSDVQQARAHLAALAELQKEELASHSQESKQEKELSVLQAGLEYFYDLYASACELVFEDDEVQRMEALQLIPRREERRTRPKKDEQPQGDKAAADGQGGEASASGGSTPAPNGGAVTPASGNGAGSGS